MASLRINNHLNRRKFISAKFVNLSKAVFMTAAEIDSQLHKYVDLLNEPQKISFLKMIKEAVDSNEDYDEVHGPMTIEQYNKDLDEAEAEFERGEYISHEEMKKLVKTW